MHSKLLVATAIAGTLALSTFGCASAGGPHNEFQDLGNAAWAESAIETLTSQGILTGLSQSRFGPGQPVTIGQLAVVLLRFEGGAPKGAPFGSEFTRAAQSGMLTDVGGTTRASGKATRAQAMTMLVNALHLQGVEGVRLGQFRDAAQVPPWARQPLSLAVQLGILSGSGGYLEPDGDLTRAELAVVLQRLESELGLGAMVGGTTQGRYVASGSTVLNGQPLLTITLAIPGRSAGGQTFTLAQDAQVYDGNLPASLLAFQVGDPVTLTLNATGQAVVVTDIAPPLATNAQPGVVAGTVTAIGGEHISISVQGSSKGHGKKTPGPRTATYVLNPDVKVVIPGEGVHGSITQIETGTFVRLVIGPAGRVDLIIAQSLPATGGGAPTLGAPVGVTASETASGVALDWVGVSGATSYQVLQSSGGAYAPVSFANGGAPTYTGATVTGLTAGVSYTFEIEALSAGGSSRPSAPSAVVEWGGKSLSVASVTVVTSGSYAHADISIAYDKPLNPASLDLSPGDYQLTDETTHSPLAVAQVTGSRNVLTVTTVPCLTSTLTTDLLQVTTAKSVVNDAAGAPTAPINASGSAHLATPLGVSAQETAAGVYVRWTPIMGATSYQVLEANGGSYTPVAPESGAASAGDGTQISGLAVGGIYSFEVEAVTAAGASLPSAPSAAVEWGAKSSPTETTTVTELAGEESFSIAIPYDKALAAATLDENLGAYAVTDLTAHQSLGVASVAVSGQTVIVQTVLAAPRALTDSIEVQTARSVVNDSAGAPTTRIAATGTL